VQEQILHQGYVPQGTVSLSASFDVCAQYATHRGTRPSGIVFTIDSDRLRAHGPIWDAYATLVRHCDWFFASEFETLTAVVGALGMKEAGRFLSSVRTASSRWPAQSTGTSTSTAACHAARCRARRGTAPQPVRRPRALLDARARKGRGRT
jgi:hypothetical protein